MKRRTLYKKTATGAQQEWSIWTQGNVIHTEWGQTDGAMQRGKDVISSGKNIGRSNETDPDEQAALEAKASWEKKKKKGYHEDPQAAMQGETDALITGGIFPMLAHRYDKHGQKIVWPAFSQPKLDGHRCIAVVKDGKASLWSRTSKPIPCLPHIVRFFEENVDGDAIFDGELYNHEYRDNFEDLTSFIRQQTEPKDGHKAVQYHIYDTPGIPGGFKDRIVALADFFDAVKGNGVLEFVDTVPVEDEGDLMRTFEQFREGGYEGSIVRNALGDYKNKRSYDLLKVKEFNEQEFAVVGVEEGRGKLAGHAMFVCETPDGTKFSTKMMGELSGLKKYLARPELAVGKVVTVQFQGWTSANNVPRFPVAVRFRKDA